MWFRYLIPLALVIGVIFYVYNNQRVIQNLTSLNAELKVENVELREDLSGLKASIELQLQQLEQLNSSIEEANQTAKRNLEAFDDSDLNRLTNRKPLLIERIINEGTRDVFKQFENESR